MQPPASATLGPLIPHDQPPNYSRLGKTDQRQFANQASPSSQRRNRLFESRESAIDHKTTELRSSITKLDRCSPPSPPTMSTTQPQQQTYVPSKVLKTDYPVSAPVLLHPAARTGPLTET